MSAYEQIGSCIKEIRRRVVLCIAVAAIGVFGCMVPVSADAATVTQLGGLGAASWRGVLDGGVFEPETLSAGRQTVPFLSGYTAPGMAGTINYSGSLNGFPNLSIGGMSGVTVSESCVVVLWAEYDVLISVAPYNGATRGFFVSSMYSGWTFGLDLAVKPVVTSGLIANGLDLPGFTSETSSLVGSFDGRDRVRWRMARVYKLTKVDATNWTYEFRDATTLSQGGRTLRCYTGTPCTGTKSGTTVTFQTTSTGYAYTEATRNGTTQDTTIPFVTTSTGTFGQYAGYTVDPTEMAALWDGVTVDVLRDWADEIGEDVAESGGGNWWEDFDGFIGELGDSVTSGAEDFVAALGDILWPLRVFRDDFADPYGGS